jgi:hypothetical protein
MKNRTQFGAIWTSLNSARCQILRLGPELLRFSENRKLKTENSQHSCNLHFPYRTRRCNSNGLLEQMPLSGDRRASARTALIATSPLRSSLTVIPRHSSAPAKSKLNGYASPGTEKDAVFDVRLTNVSTPKPHHRISHPIACADSRMILFSAANNER